MAASGIASVEGPDPKQMFDLICGKLNLLDDGVLQHAWRLFEESRRKFDAHRARMGGSVTAPLHEQQIACSLYIASRAKSISTVGGEEMVGTGVSLSQLLRAAGVSLTDFFGLFKSFIHIMAIDASFDAHLKSLENKFVVSSILFRKYAKVGAREELFVRVARRGDL